MASTPIATVLASTLTKSRKKLILASIKSNALMAWAFASNRVEFEDGGHEITNPLTLGRNPNITSYEYYDEQPITQTNAQMSAKAPGTERSGHEKRTILQSPGVGGR